MVHFLLLIAGGIHQSSVRWIHYSHTSLLAGRKTVKSHLFLLIKNDSNFFFILLTKIIKLSLQKLGIFLKYKVFKKIKVVNDKNVGQIGALLMILVRCIFNQYTCAVVKS